MQSEKATLLYQDGFIPSPNEDEENFEARVNARLSWSRKLWKEDLILDDDKITLPFEQRFPEEILSDGGSPVKQRYGCLPRWVPAYHSNRGLPFLTGGMAVELSSPDQPQQVFFQLKELYKSKENWFIYPREEILSHEMCHVVRFPLKSHRYEETLAYSVSGSAFRRWLGGALLSPLDNLLLLAGIISWISVDMLQLIGLESIFLPWLLRSLLPLLIILGLTRNIRIRRELKLATLQLEKIFSTKVSVRVIFCLCDEEIGWLAQVRAKDDLIQWWKELPGFRGDFLRKVFPLIEATPLGR
jgi:hypothetical protein